MESNYVQLHEEERRKRRRQGKGNYLYVRYADDWVVLCNGSKADALAMKEELGGILSEMGLTLSEEKTKLTHRTEGFIFLGYKVIREVGTNGKMVPKVLIPDKAIKRYRDNVQGFHGVLSRMSYEYRLRSAYGKVRYYEGSTFRTKSSKMILPSDHKAKRLLTKTWHNPYTAKEAVAREKLIILESLWSGYEHRHGTMDIREEMIARKGTMCAMNGPDCESRGTPLHPSEIEIDHIKPHRRFKYPQDADRIENQQILCTDCHRAKTKNDLEVLSRMR